MPHTSTVWEPSAGLWSEGCEQGREGRNQGEETRSLGGKAIGQQAGESPPHQIKMADDRRLMALMAVFVTLWRGMF